MKGLRGFGHKKDKNLMARRKGKLQKAIEEKGSSIPKVYKVLEGNITSGYHYDKKLENLPVYDSERIRIILGKTPEEWSRYLCECMGLSDFELTAEQKDMLFRDQRTKKKR